MEKRQVVEQYMIFFAREQNQLFSYHSLFFSAVLGLHCCPGVSLVVASGGLLSGCGAGAAHSVASLGVEHRR